MTSSEGRAGFWRRLGPGMLLAAVSIGASHLVLSPQAGALYGFDLLWLIVAAHVLKYPAFEFGPRYAAATGTSLLQGYARVPGPRGWAPALFLLGATLQGIGVLAGVVGVSGAVLATWTGVGDDELFSVGLIGLIVVLLLVGGFRWLDRLNKGMIAALAAATLLAFVVALPPPEAAVHLVLPKIPAGSIVLVAALVGWMPTGVDVSVWHSFWTLEKLQSLGLEPGDADRAARRRQLAISLSDMRTGYGVSLGTGLVFVCLGAMHLQGRGADLAGIQFAEAISTAYTTILGRWMFHVFMLTAFFAMFSTSYAVVDGFSRSFSEALATLSPALAAPRARRRTWAGFVVVSAAFAAITLRWVGNPVALVTAVALISLFIAPVLYGLNVYCVQRHVTEPELRPARATVILGLLGVVFVTVAVGVTVWVKLT